MASKRFAASAFILATAMIVVGGQFFAQARIGHDRGALTAANGRYGETIGSTEPTLKTSIEKVDEFKHKGIKISTEYDQEGKVWRITYHQKDLAENLMTELMKRNGGERKWSTAMKYRTAKYWVTADKQLHAVYYGYPIYDLIIMTAEAAKSERHPKTLALNEELEPKDDNKDSEPGETKKAPDPLEGF